MSYNGSQLMAKLSTSLAIHIDVAIPTKMMDEGSDSLIDRILRQMESEGKAALAVLQTFHKDVNVQA
jgi:hypothetical protein